MRFFFVICSSRYQVNLGMVVFFSSLENHLLSLKLLILNYFLRVKEDAWQICVEHFTVI
jgi:hypothetical protein